MLPSDDAIMCMQHPAVVVETRGASIGVTAARAMLRNPGLNPGVSTKRNVIFATAWRAVYLRAFASGQRHARPGNDSAELQASIVQLIFGLTLAIIGLVTM